MLGDLKHRHTMDNDRRSSGGGPRAIVTDAKQLLKKSAVSRTKTRQVVKEYGVDDSSEYRRHHRTPRSGTHGARPDVGEGAGRNEEDADDAANKAAGSAMSTSASRKISFGGTSTREFDKEAPALNISNKEPQQPASKDEQSPTPRGVRGANAAAPNEARPADRGGGVANASAVQSTAVKEPSTAAMELPPLSGAFGQSGPRSRRGQRFPPRAPPSPIDDIEQSKGGAKMSPRTKRKIPTALKISPRRKKYASSILPRVRGHVRSTASAHEGTGADSADRDTGKPDNPAILLPKSKSPSHRRPVRSPQATDQKQNTKAEREHKRWLEEQGHWLVDYLRDQHL